MIARYYVAPCDERHSDSPKRTTWDVMERLRADEAIAVSNHNTRADARAACRELNANADWRLS